MRSFAVEYKSFNNVSQFAKIELPINSNPHNFILLAHCFMVKSNVDTLKTLSHYLTRAVLEL